MIIEFSVSNYRSIKTEQTLSMVAENSKNKEDNTFEVTLANGSKLRLLRTAIIYGANASGKSNVLKAFDTMRSMIISSRMSNIDDPIIAYDPFQFDDFSNITPTSFSLTFILESIKHHYEFSFNGKEILSEKLDYYPKGQPATLFERVKSSSNIQDEISFGTSLKNKPSDKVVLKNHLYLSQFGGKPHEQMTNIFRFFSQSKVSTSRNSYEILIKTIGAEILNNKELQLRLSRLLKIADTKIESVFSEMDNIKYQTKDNTSDSGQNFTTLSKHLIYDKDGKTIGEKDFFLRDESAGTNVLFGLGGLILTCLDKGEVIFFDELDNSLHPKLTKFLIRLFQNPITNRNNAQLVFASHEVTLLDKEIFRRDQIWFTEKNKYGVTELYSAKDVEGVREDTAFDKWYLSGKFGGEPRIKEVEFIFGN
jgi:AAA15 family ATPase/GTPase